MHIELKICSLLLSYPEAPLKQAIGAIQSGIENSTLITPNLQQALAPLLAALSQDDLIDLQENYVNLFDRTRALSLHLFEHIHGESRDRGQAMVDLKHMYDEAGFTIVASELPDYLPMYLEFYSTRLEHQQREGLCDIAHILAALEQRLTNRQSNYSGVFRVLIALGQQQPSQELLDGLLAQAEDDPQDLAALDKIWQEEMVTFGGNGDENACSSARFQRRIRAAQRDRTLEI